MNKQIGSRLEVLVIDNEQPIRDIIVGNLHERFPAFVFRQAESGNVALTLINERVPDLILLDLSMPGLNGFALVRLLRSRDRTRSVPIIAVSALNDRMSVQKALTAGANDYCLKPINFGLLSIKIENACARLLGRDNIRTRQRTAPRRRVVGATSAVMPISYPEREGIWVCSSMEVQEGDPLLFNAEKFFGALRVETESPFLWSRVEHCCPEDDRFNVKLLFEDIPKEYEEQLSVLNRSRQRFSKYFGGGSEHVHLEFPCEVKDLSGEGLRIVGSLPFQAGSMVDLDIRDILNQIDLPAWDTKVRARIQWSEEQSEQKIAGVRFEDIDEDLRQELMIWSLKSRPDTLPVPV